MKIGYRPEDVIKEWYPGDDVAYYHVRLWRDDGNEEQGTGLFDTAEAAEAEATRICAEFNGPATVKS